MASLPKAISSVPAIRSPRKCAAFRAALMEAVTEQDIKDIAAKLRDDAKAGDKAAVKLLFQYVIGKPQPAVDPDALDLQEMRGFMAGAIPPEAFEEMQRGLPLAMLLKLWPFFLFAKEQTNLQGAADLHEAREQRRQERAQRKAERRQRRQEAQQQADRPPPEPAAPPSPNGHSRENGFAAVDDAPSPNGDIGENTLAMILDWLRQQRGPSNGDVRP